MNDESQLYLEASEKQNKTLKICPTCLGKGFFEEPSKQSKEIVNSMEEYKTYSLPKIINSTKPSSKSRKQHTWRMSDVTLPILPSKSTPCSRQSYASKSLTNCSNNVERLPQLKRDISHLSKDSNDSQKDYTIGKREITNITEFAKNTKAKLKSVNLDDLVTGVINTVHIARQDSDIALTIMPQVNRQICTLLKSMKLYHIHIAMEAVKVLYTIIPLISRPEFDEMIHLLLGKVSDLKMNIRNEANAALDVIAANTPPQYIVRAVIGKGPKSKNAYVRETSARLLDHVVDSIGPNPLINAYNLREMRRHIVESGVLFLDDQNVNVRKLGKILMSKLIAVPEFEEVLIKDVPQKMYKRVEGIILNIKYEKQCLSLNK